MAHTSLVWASIGYAIDYASAATKPLQLGLTNLSLMK